MTWNGQIFGESSQNGGKYQVNIQVSDENWLIHPGKFHVGPRPSFLSVQKLCWLMTGSGANLSSRKMIAIIPLYWYLNPCLAQAADIFWNNRLVFEDCENNHS
jgi:hypothetical protein